MDLADSPAVFLIGVFLNAIFKQLLTNWEHHNIIRMIYIGSQRVTMDIIAISYVVFISRRDFRCVSITLVLCPCQCCESRGRLVSRRRPNGQSVVKETIVASWHPALTPLLCIFRRPSLEKGILTSGIAPPLSCIEASWSILCRRAD